VRGSGLAQGIPGCHHGMMANPEATGKSSPKPRTPSADDFPIASGRFPLFSCHCSVLAIRLWPFRFSVSLFPSEWRGSDAYAPNVSLVVVLVVVVGQHRSVLRISHSAVLNPFPFTCHSGSASAHRPGCTAGPGVIHANGHAPGWCLTLRCLWDPLQGGA
jgi:hypothetical protein